MLTQTEFADDHTVIKRFFCFHRIEAYGEKYYPRCPIPFPRLSFKKNPFTMSKTDQRPYAEKSGYYRRNWCDGNLVAYILEGQMIGGELVEPIGIEPMT